MKRIILYQGENEVTRVSVRFADRAYRNDAIDYLPLSPRVVAAVAAGYGLWG